MTIAKTIQTVQKSKLFYVTTPIFYVNAGTQSISKFSSNVVGHGFVYIISAPHIGHLYSASIADCIYRYERLRDRSAKFLFSTGTDEHGTKIQQAASAHNQNPEQYCTVISDAYKSLFQKSGIDYTHFNRTTDQKHHFPAVQQFWVCLFRQFNLICNETFVFYHSRDNWQPKITFIKRIMPAGIVCRMKHF